MQQTMNEAGEAWAWDRGPIGRLVKIAYITLRRQLDEKLKATGLTHAQWNALTVIHHFSGITPSELENILLVERPSITSLINGMEKRGWVIRREHPQDARYKQLFLTETGERLADETGSFTHEIENRVKEGMTEEEFAQLRQLLIKMIGLFMP